MIEYNEFKIRAYGFRELAQLYLPEILPESASKQLVRWIKHNKTLLEQLKLLGYIPGTKLLSPEMVKTIISYLGEP